MRFYLHLIITWVTSMGLLSCQLNSKGNANGQLQPPNTAPLHSNSNVTSKIREPLSGPIFMELRFGMTGSEVDSMLQQYSIQKRINIRWIGNKRTYIYSLNLENISIPMSIGYSLNENQYVQSYSLSTIDDEYGKMAIFQETFNFFSAKYGAICYEHSWHGEKISEFIEKRFEWKTDDKKIELIFGQKIDENDQIVGNIFIGFDNSTSCSSNKDILQNVSDGLNKRDEDEYLKRKFGIPSKSESEKTKKDF